MKKIGLLLFIYLLSNNFIKAQPANYWSVSFNSEASLLAGAVAGGNSDITSIFYNPAGIAEVEDKKFALSANLFNLSYSNYENALGTGQNLDYWGFTVKPRFVSYLFKLKKTENLFWQFAIFNRDEYKLSVYDQINKPVQLIHPGINENYIANIDIINDFNDSWGGFGVSYRLNKNLKIGGSFLTSIKNLKYLNLITIDILPIEENLPDTIEPYISSSVSYEKINLYDVRIIGKIGIRYHLGQFSFGMNLSLPSVKLFGNSDVKRKVSNTGIYYNGTEIDDVYINESAIYLKSGVKDPLSISFGAVYTNLSEKSKFYFTTEYFHKIETYKLIDGTKVSNDKYEPASDFLSYKHGAKSLVNLAFGIQHLFSEKFELLAGFRTNLSPYNTSNDDQFQYLNEVIATPVDLYHLTGGAKFNYKKLSIIAGLEYSMGRSKEISEFVNFAEPAVRPGEKLVLAGDNNNNMKYVYNLLSIYFGVSFGF